MSERIKTITNILLYILFAIGVVLIGIFYFGKKVPGTEGTLYEEPVITGTILVTAVVYLIIAALVAIIFPVIFLITNFKKAVYALIGVLFFVIILAISYVLSSGNAVPLHIEVPAYTFKLVDTGLLATYIMAGLAFLMILVTEVISIFK